MRYEIDYKNHIVDFYIEDDSGKEVHEALSFEDFKELVETIKSEIDQCQ